MSKNLRVLFIFIILLALHAELLVSWIAQDSSVPGIDNSIHLTHSLTCHELLSDLSFQHLARSLSISSYYPPFYPCSSTVFYRLLDTSLQSALFGNVFMLLLLLLVTYLYASRLYDSLTALLSVLILSFYPMTLYLSRAYFLDLPLCFFVVLAFYMLFLSKNFTVPSYSILFGAVSGLGMLTKWTFAFFLAAPVFISLAQILRRKDNTKLSSLFNVVKCAVVFLIIAAPWYAVNASSLAHTLRGGFYLDAGHDPSPGNLLFYVFYARALFNEQLGLYFFMVFLFALFCMFLHKKYTASDNFVISALVSAYILLTLIHNKDARFTYPYLPLIAIVTARGLLLAPFSRTKAFLPVVLLMLCAVCAATYLKFCPRPVREDWKLQSVSQFLTDELKPEEMMLIGMESSHEKVNMYSFQYYFFRAFFEKNKYFPFTIKPAETMPRQSANIFVIKKKNKENFSYGMPLQKGFILPDGEWLLVYFSNSIKQ